MTARSSILAVLALSSLWGASTRGDVGGTVVLEGKPPVWAPVDLSTLPQCAQQHAGGTIPNETVVSGPRGELANVIVSIKMAGQSNSTLPTGAVAATVIDQKGCQFLPHVVAVQKGAELLVLNHDTFLHHIHSLPAICNPVSVAQPSEDAVGKRLDTSAAEYYLVKCDIHPWMKVWVGVMDTPYFAVTDTQGKFVLPTGLADGEYTAVAWQEHYGTVEGKLVVKDGSGDIKLVFKAASVDTDKPGDTALPAGAKLSTGGTPACCEVTNSKAALMKAAAKP